MSVGLCKDDTKFTEREVSYMRTIVDAAAQELGRDKVLGEALQIVGWVLRGWTIEAARHQVTVVEPKLLASGGRKA